MRKCGVCHYVNSLSRSESRAPCVRGVHSSNKHCVAVYRPIWTRFSAFFKVMLFQTHYIVILCVASWRHNFGEIAVKNCEMSKKSAEKFVRTTSYRQLRDLKKIPPQLFRAENADVHLCKTFTACSYLALRASVEIRIGSPKTARNEHVCLHQKSYRKYIFRNLFFRSCIQDGL